MFQNASCQFLYMVCYSTVEALTVMDVMLKTEMLKLEEDVATRAKAYDCCLNNKSSRYLIINSRVH